MRVELKLPESVTEPRLWVWREQVLAMVLRPGSIEWGLAVFRDGKGRPQRGRHRSVPPSCGRVGRNHERADFDPGQPDGTPVRSFLERQVCTGHR